MHGFLSLISYLFLILALNVQAANNIELKIEPSRPFIGESFKVLIHIYSQTQETPKVLFNLGGLTLLQKDVSVGTSAYLKGGKFVTTKNYTFSYHVSAPKAKVYRLTNIAIELEGKKHYIPNKAITVLSGPEKLRNYFLQAETSKTTTYLGEGIDIKYYFYSKGSISQLEIKEYPKLNNFLKRFTDVGGNVPAETVNYRNEIYKRSLIYATRAYPEKIGKVIIDPLKLRLKTRRWGHLRTITLMNPKIQLLVRPLPAENVPKNFTGLVGNHEIHFTLNKSKFLVNEIVEGKFEITGEGLLEKFAPPVLYKHDALEQFDTRSEIIDMNKVSSKKIFDYTFIPRTGLEIDERQFSLSFFDPNEEKYYERKFTLPALSVVGKAVKPPEQATNNIVNNTDSVKPVPTGPPLPSLVGPMNFNELFLVLKRIKTLNLILLLLIFLLLISSIRYKSLGQNRKKIIYQMIQKIQKNGISYKSLYDLLTTYYGKELSAQEIVMKGRLSPEAKKYFKDILDIVGHHEFSQEKGFKKVNIDMKFFKEFLK